MNNIDFTLFLHDVNKNEMHVCGLYLDIGYILKSRGIEFLDNSIVLENGYLDDDKENVNLFLTFGSI